MHSVKLVPAYESGHNNLSKAVHELRSRAGASASVEPSLSSGDSQGRKVDIVRKLDLLQRINDVGADGTEGSPEHMKSLQDRVFHAMVIEKLPDFSSLAPSFMPRSEVIQNAKALALPAEEENATKTRSDPRSWANRPGVSKRSTSKAESQQSQIRVKEIIVPLGPERLSNEEIAATLKNEFAVRYCESLGIAPTASNVADISRRMPLSQCHIRQVIHPGLGRGERKNYVAIAPPCYRALLQRDAHKPKTIDMGDEGDEVPDDRPLSGVTASPVLPSSSSALGNAFDPCFEEYKFRFVPPFNLSSRFEPDPDRRPVEKAQDSAKGTKRNQRSTTSSTQARSRETPRQPDDALGGGAGDASDSRSGHKLPLIDPSSARTMSKLEALDAALGKVRRGEALSADDAARLHKAAADERPLVITEEHLRALDAFAERSQKGQKPPSTETQPASTTRVSLIMPQDGAADAFSSVTAETTAEELPSLHNELRQGDAAAQRDIDHYLETSGRADVKQFQFLFVKDFPFTKFFKDKEEVAGIKAALVSEHVNNAVQAMLHFVFTAYIAPLATTPHHVVAPSDKDEVFVRFYETILDLMYGAESLGAAFTEAAPSRLAPMVLLLLRVALECEMKHYLPAFLRSPIGSRLSVTMDELLTAVVDPLNLVAHISVVDSSLHSMRVRVTKRPAARVPPLQTSPITQFIIGDPQAPQAKALSRLRTPALQRGLAELKAHLTPMARARLLQVMAMKKFKLPSEMEHHLLDS